MCADSWTSRAGLQLQRLSQQEQQDGEKKKKNYGTLERRRREIGWNGGGATMPSPAQTQPQPGMALDGSDTVASSRQSDAMGPLTKRCLVCSRTAWLGSGFQLLYCNS